MIWGFREEGEENCLAWTVAVSRDGGGRTGTGERGDAGTLTGTAGNSWVKLANGGRFDLDPEVSFDNGAVTLFVVLEVGTGISRIVERTGKKEGIRVAAHGHGN